MTDVEQIDSDLSAYVIGDLADEYEPDTEARTLATIDEADRALWWMRQLETDMTRHERLFDTRIGQLQERRDEVLGVMRRQHDWWARRVEMWARAHAAETKSKTINLPSGQVTLRQGRPRIEPMSKEPAADVAPEFVRVQRSWDKQAIAKVTMPGPVAEDVDAPEGYEARFCVTAEGKVLGDVVTLVPTAPTVTIKAGAR